GRKIRTTLRHPFLTVDGWKPLGELRAGDRVAVPRRIDVAGADSLGEERVKILAYLLGDGTFTGPCPGFTNGDPRLRADFRDAVDRFGGLAMRESERNRLARWLESLGLWGKTAREKFIPEPVFRLRREELACFLNRLFATDGWATVLASGQAQLGFSSTSERLARQVQHLLLRFGVIASLRRRLVKYAGGRRPAFQLDITDAESIRAFSGEIGIFGKEAALAKVRAALARKKYQTNRDLIPAGVWRHIDGARQGATWRSIGLGMGLTDDSNLHVGRRALSRRRLAAFARALGDS